MKRSITVEAFVDGSVLIRAQTNDGEPAQWAFQDTDETTVKFIHAAIDEMLKRMLKRMKQ